MRVRAVLAVVVCGGLLVGCGSSATDSDEAGDPGPSHPAADAPGTARTHPRAPQPEPGRLVVAGETVTGEWEEGALLGDPLEIGPVDGREPHAEILYAARRLVQDPGGRPMQVTYVATGVRDGSRILRTISALTPDTASPADRIELYGGDVLGARGADERVADGSYLLIGTVPGDVDVSVTHPDGRETPVTGSSTRMLPGYTVFYDSGAWGEGWDQVQLAPLTVTTSDGHRAGVRARSWTG